MGSPSYPLAVSAEPEQYVIADLLANAIEPWDSLTARELRALDAQMEPDGQPAVPVVIAAYSNERGPVLIDGGERLQWLASAPRNQKTIAAGEVRIEQDAVDEESAHRAAVALRVNRPHASSRVKALLARRLQSQFGWSQATIAEVFKVSRPAVSDWLRQLSGSDVPEVTGRDGRVYPARGKQAEPETNSVPVTLADALRALHAEHHAAVQRSASIRHVRINRHGTTDPGKWTVIVSSQSAGAAAALADLLREEASDLIALARKLDDATPS